MSPTKEIQVGNVTIGGNSPLTIIAGPCVLENEDVMLTTGREIKRICEKIGASYIFKSSYLKDNRTSIHVFNGPGLVKGLETLQRIKQALGVPVTSDVHSIEQIPLAAQVLDLIQIPSFLCKQTSLMKEAARTGKPINVKKGQFIAPINVKHIIEKIESEGNHNIMLTERGTCFGYFDIINDFRALPTMRAYGYPVVYDVTHSIRTMGISSDDPAGGQREFVPYLSRAAIAIGCDALFVEVHPDPCTALCDSASQLALDQLEPLLRDAKRLHDFVRCELSVLPNVLTGETSFESLS